VGRPKRPSIASGRPFLQKEISVKIAAYSILGSTLAMTSSDAFSGPAIVQYGALAILGGTVYYLLKHTIPSLIKGFLEEQKSTRDDFRSSLSGISKSVDCMATIIAGARRPDGQ
jgi:hypothetical protein